MSTTTQDQLRAALNAVTAAMNTTIAVAKELGKHEERDTLIMQRDGWVRAANRICNHGAGPRGRTAVPPIVPSSYSLKPMVRTRPAVSYPALRVVELQPDYHEQVRLMRAEAERQVQHSRELLEQCRRDRQGRTEGLPDAG